MEREIRAEQACRGVTRESGWGIIARSSGFTAENAQNLSAAFNEAMNPIVAKMGQSVFSCKMSGGDVLFGVLTKRSGADGRFYLFTNARVLPGGTYAENMASDPGLLLGLSFDEFLTDDPHTETIGAASFAPRSAGAAETARKYGIDKDALAELFFDTYVSLTSGKVLCFDTAVSNDRTDQAMEVIQDMVCLAMQGLPPNMRGMITFSSGRDNSCRFCVQSREGGVWLQEGREALHFQTDPAKRAHFDTEMRSVTNDGDLIWRMCRDLAGMNPDERRDLLDFVDEMCGGLSETGPAYTESVILSSYYIYLENKGNEISVIEALFLILLLQNDLERGVIRDPGSRVNRWLSTFLGIVADAETCPNVRIMQGLLARAFAENEKRGCSAAPDSGLYDTVLRALQYADGAGCLALADGITKESASDVRQNAMEALLRTAEDLHEKWTPDFAMDLFRWICREDISPGWLTDLCWERREAGYAALLKQLLDDNIAQETRAAQGDPKAAGPLFNEVEMDYLCRALEGAGGESGSGSEMVLTDGAVRLLTDHYAEFSSPLQLACVRYFLRVCTENAGEDGRALRRIDGIGNEALRDDILAYISGPEHGYFTLWEKYLTRKVLRTDMTVEELAGICETYNAFAPGGPFETAAVKILVKNTNKAYAAAAGRDPSGYYKIYLDSVKALARLAVSDRAKQAGTEQLKLAFTGNLDLSALIRAAYGWTPDFDRALADPADHPEDSGVLKKAVVAEKRRAVREWAESIGAAFLRGQKPAEDDPDRYRDAVCAFRDMLWERKYYDKGGAPFYVVSALAFTRDERREIREGLLGIAPDLWQESHTIPIDILLLAAIRVKDGEADYAMRLLDQNTEKVRKALDQMTGQGDPGSAAWPEADPGAALRYSVLLTPGGAAEDFISYAEEPGFDSYDLARIADELAERREPGKKRRKNTPGNAAGEPPAAAGNLPKSAGTEDGNEKPALWDLSVGGGGSTAADIDARQYGTEDAGKQEDSGGIRGILGIFKRKRK